MTKSMTVDFIKPVYIDNELKVEGKVLEKTGRHEALIEGNLYNEKGTLCARSRATFVIFSPAVAKRLGIAQKEHLEWFDEMYNLT
jgi:acyl-coenzyme A thioesterase PaaI-like protein